MPFNSVSMSMLSDIISGTFAVPTASYALNGGGGGSTVSASYALSASYSDTASYVSGSSSISSSYSLSSSYALTSSYSNFATTSSYALTVSGSSESSSYALSSSYSDFAITSSYALTVSGSSESSSYALSSSYSDFATTSSYAENAGGGRASTFIDLTDVPNSYSGGAQKIVRVNDTANGLTFDSISTGVIINWTTESYAETIATTLTGGTYTKVTHQLEFYGPLKITSMSYSSSTAATYSIYLSNTLADQDIKTLLFSSQSWIAGKNMLYFDNYILWEPETYYLTIENHDGAISWLRTAGADTTEFYNFPRTYYLGFGEGSYAAGLIIYAYKYDRIDEYGVSGSTSSGVGDKIFLYKILDK